jgi:hypothetical protein
MDDQVLSTCVTEMVTQLPGSGQRRKYTMLPIEFANGWLFTIKKVRPELQANYHLARLHTTLKLLTLSFLLGIYCLQFSSLKLQDQLEVHHADSRQEFRLRDHPQFRVHPGSLHRGFVRGEGASYRVRLVGEGAKDTLNIRVEKDKLLQ